MKKPDILLSAGASLGLLFSASAMAQQATPSTAPIDYDLRTAVPKANTPPVRTFSLDPLLSDTVESDRGRPLLENDRVRTPGPAKVRLQFTLTLGGESNGQVSGGVYAGRRNLLDLTNR